MNPPAGTEIWLVDLARWGPVLLDVETAMPRLSADEIERCAMISDPAQQALRRAAYTVRRLAIERMFGCSLRRVPLARGPHGRPELPKVATHSGGGAVSLAHTGRYALAGCARGGSIGVDLEAPRGVAIDARRRDIIITAARALTAAPLPPGEGACMLQSWVRLEALAKADGRGIGHLLAAIGAIGGGGNATGATTLAALGGIEVRDLDTGPALYGAVALTRGAGAVSLFAAPDAIAHLLDVGLIPTR